MQKDQLGEGHRTSSWILKMTSLSADQTANNAENNPFNTTVHIELAKTKVRAVRWQEEIIQEEMHWAIVDIEWWAQQQITRVNAHTNASPDLHQGLMAYVYKLANIQIGFASNYARKWIPVFKCHGFDYSFASHYETADIHNPKEKKTVGIWQDLYVKPESNGKLMMSILIS